MIELRDLYKSYGKKKVLEGISFTAHAGELIAIVGRNGSGKSTLLKIMAGIIKPDSGEISYYDKDVLKNPKIIRRLCGYLPQTDPLMEDLTVRDNLRLWGANKKNLTRDLLEEFMLEDILKLPVKKLSGGMKRRVSFVAATIHKPAILLLDEPTLALDMENRYIIRGWIENYRKRNGIVLMVSHEREEIQFSDQIINL